MATVSLYDRLRIGNSNIALSHSWAPEPPNAETFSQKLSQQCDGPTQYPMNWLPSELAPDPNKASDLSELYQRLIFDNSTVDEGEEGEEQDDDEEEIFTWKDGKDRSFLSAHDSYGQLASTLSIGGLIAIVQFRTWAHPRWPIRVNHAKPNVCRISSILHRTWIHS